MAAPRITSFVDAFLADLNAAVAESARSVTGDIENALHQKLESCGDKKKQARQLNAVAKGSSAYMQRIQATFEKNFDKFELYVRRNVVMVPADVADRVQELHEKRLQMAASGDAGAKAQTETEREEDSHLTPEQRREKQLEEELCALRQQIRQLEEDTQRMTLEQQALEAKAQQFKQVVSKLEFFDQLPSTTISPLKRTVEHVTALQRSLEKMEDVRGELEEDTRAFKRQKMETRDTYKNLRQRFLARTATVSFASLEDLKKMNDVFSAI